LPDIEEKKDKKEKKEKDHPFDRPPPRSTEAKDEENKAENKVENDAGSTESGTPKAKEDVEMKEASASNPTSAVTEFTGPRGIAGTGGTVQEVRSIDNHFYRCSVFIQGIPLNLKRDLFVKVFEKREGFQRLILCDPGKWGQRLRFGWAQFTNQDQCAAVLQEVALGGLNGHKLTGSYFLNLLPKHRFVIPLDRAAPYSTEPERVKKDVVQTVKLARKLDRDFGIENNPALAVDLLTGLKLNLRRLNYLLAYIRRVHFTCYYSGETCLTEERLFSNCGPYYQRETLKQWKSWETTDPTEEDLEWARDVDEGHALLLKAPKPEPLKDWLDRQKQRIFRDNTIKVAEGKFRCALCRKLFRAPGFVHKHLVNKHSPIFKKYLSAERDKQYFENYSHDPVKITQRMLDGPSESYAHTIEIEKPMPVQEFREIPVHFAAPPPRTVKSYKDVQPVEDEDAMSESDEDLDYGFGDYVKPPKFNL